MAVCKDLYVVDASVVIKWLFQDEIDSSRALLVKRDFLNGNIKLATPTNMFFETLNVVGLKDRHLAVYFFSQLQLFEIEEYHLTVGLVSKAVEIIEKCPGVSFYDAIYHALALRLGGIFLTADEKYFQKTKKHKNISLLKDYRA